MKFWNYLKEVYKLQNLSIFVRLLVGTEFKTEKFQFCVYFKKAYFRCLCFFWYILCVVFVIIISCCCLKKNKTVYLRRQNMCKCQSIGRTVLRQFVMKRIYTNIGVFVLIELKKIIFIVQNIQVSDFFIFLKFSNNVVYAFLYILEWVKRLYILKIKVCYVLSIFKKYYCFKVTN